MINERRRHEEGTNAKIALRYGGTKEIHSILRCNFEPFGKGWYKIEFTQTNKVKF
jgi:hypothetical protein